MGVSGCHLCMLCSLEGKGIKLKKTLPLESVDSKDYSRNPKIYLLVFYVSSSD